MPLGYDGESAINSQQFVALGEKIGRLKFPVAMKLVTSEYDMYENVYLKLQDYRATGRGCITTCSTIRVIQILGSQ